MSARIDHLVILVADLERGRAALEALGFQLTARGEHAHFGTANHLVVLDHSYLELLSVVEPRAENSLFRERAARSPGFWALAMASADVAREAARLRRLGLPASDPIDFGRPVVVEGEALEARFRVLMWDPAPHAGVMTFYCEHRTPQLIWRPSWQHHPNGAQALSAVTIAAPYPRRLAAEYARLWDCPARPGERDDTRLILEGQEVVIADMSRLEGPLQATTDAQAAERMVCASLRVASLPAARARVARFGGVEPSEDAAGRIVVRHTDLRGVAFELRDH